MLAVSHPTNDAKDERVMEGFRIGIDELLDFSDGNLLDSIVFDDLFMEMHGGEVLPDLEIDSELFAEFSSSGGEESEVNISICEKNEEYSRVEKNLDPSFYNQGEEIVNKREESRKGVKGKKSSRKNSQGKRKVKVDWTPELHRRFVQAVEQLGVDKAVPSRILELMGIDCLTRHNIASHLQKYRSHIKHLIAREAEAANWSQRRKMYACGGGKKTSAWVPPTSAMGFPPMAPPPPMQHFRPLHVWGHPARPPPPDPLFWHGHHQRRLSHSSVTCVAPPQVSQPHTNYRPDFGIPTRPTGPQPPFDFHPSKESIDAAIGEVLSKPWSPLPLGLKPPSVDLVLEELQCQGISNIPPSTCA